MLFIFGIKTKPISTENRKIMQNGSELLAHIGIYKRYWTVFFIPLIPLGKFYSIEIPQTNEYFDTNFFTPKMPEKYLEICKEIGRKY